MRNIIMAGIIFLASVAVAQAHSVWVNAFMAEAHQPPHVMVSLGWGHSLPMDDILNSPNGRVEVESFELIDPALQKTALLLPAVKPAEKVGETRDVTVYPGDLAVQKVAFTKDATPGVYQFVLSSKPNFYTQYIDAMGRERLLLKPKNQVKDAKKVLMSVKYSAFAKSYVALGSWQQPKPLGHGLEIVPRTDLSAVRVGDLVEVDVLFYGKPLSATAQSLDFITAHSASFGQSDGFSLFSYLMKGRGQFRVQSAGQWVISVNHKEDVTANGPLHDLVGKVDQVYHGATLTFYVK